jgi:septum formation protein
MISMKNKNPKRQIILASQSPQRKALMEALGFPFLVKPSDIDESAISAENHEQRAMMIALAKAQKISIENPDSIVIAADTFTQYKNRAFEKPKSHKEAADMIKQMSGQKVVCYSGFAYLDPTNNFEYKTTAVTKYKFRDLSDSEISNYVNNNPVLTWSAAFSAAYPAGLILIEEINGSLSGFTHGLPIELVAKSLAKSGVI